MNGVYWFEAAACALLAAAVLATASRFWNKGALSAAGRAAAFAAFGLFTAGFAVRWIWYVQAMDTGVLQAFPVTTLYESAVFLAAALSLIAALLSDGLGLLAAFVYAAAGTAVLALPLFADTKAAPFLPSLKSIWLAVHVTMSLAAYALFALAAAAGASLLLRDNAGRAQLVRRLIALGAAVFTVGGLLFGALWAQASWGRFWAWDPKETWAFITWCVYLAILHFDYRRSFTGRQLGACAVAGFAVVLFSYLGINLILPGLHSYASFTQI